jgi:hypothetical protein
VSDRLELANAIVAAGIERDKAGRLASTIVELIQDTVATKADVAAVRTDLGATAASLKADIVALRGDLRMTDAAVKAQIAALEAKLTRIEQQLLTRLGSLAILLAVLLFAAMHWPPR